MKLKLATAALIAFASFSAHAVQKDITITASVDPTLEMLRADGSALPSTLEMAYVPGSGLQPVSIDTVIHSNLVTKDVEVRLVAAPTLINMIDAGSAPVPLTVSFGGQAITTTATVIDATDLFPGGSSGASVTKQLQISQTTAGILADAGSYQGVVSILVTQTP